MLFASDVRNFFGIVELLFTFVEGSPARHAYFVGVQRQSNPDDPALHLKDSAKRGGTVVPARFVVWRRREYIMLR